MDEVRVLWDIDLDGQERDFLLALLRKTTRVREVRLREVTTIYVEPPQGALTPSLYLGPTDRQTIPEGTYFLMREVTGDE